MRIYLHLRAIAALLAITVPAAAEDAAQSTTATSTGQAEVAVESGKVVVSNRPVEVLAGPSSSSSVLYGFPAGRPFRLIGSEAGFTHIQDLKSSATGWIDSTAVAEAPTEGTSASYAPRQNPTAMVPPQQTSGNGQSPDTNVSTPSNGRRGPLGGLLGGLFGNR